MLHNMIIDHAPGHQTHPELLQAAWVADRDGAGAHGGEDQRGEVRGAPARALVERFDIEPFPDFSAK